MGIQSMLNRGGNKVDKSACIPFGTPAGSIALTTAYQTLQSITGKGYLDTAVLKGHASLNSLRIIVDGVVKFEGSCNSATFNSGFVKRDMLGLTSAIYIVDPATPFAGNALNNIAGNVVGYPYTANAAQAQTLSINADSIYFNSSLLIEAKTGAANTAGYYLSGGYQ
jgi:hypothetical protein